MRSRNNKITPPNLPNEITVLGQTFQIRLVPSVDDDGTCDGPNRMITVSETQTQAEADSTLLHEIIHAALFVSGHAETLGDDREEGIVLALEHALNGLYTRRK